MRRGLALIWVAIVGFLLVILAGLALDTSWAVLTSFDLQNAADASSLAGAMKVLESDDAARDKAIEVAAANLAAGVSVELSRNEGNAPDGDIVLGSYDRDTGIFDPTASSYNAVRVVARRTDTSLGGPLELFFGPILGVNTVNIERPAIAMVGGGTGAGLIVLDDQSECALRISGTNDLIVTTTPEYDGEGAIQVDSDNPCAMCTSGSSLTIEADATNIVGDFCPSGNPTIEPPPSPNQPYMPDPLAGIPEPSYGPPDLGTIDASGDPTTYPPGYYSGGLRATSTGTTITLANGIYVLDGEGLYVDGGSLIADEVMFFIVGTGRAYLGGSGFIHISPISDMGNTYWNISIFQARDNTNESTIIGTTNMDLEGSYYFPACELELGGTGIALGNQVIAWRMWIHGTGTFTIAYDGRFPAPGSKVFLVQ